MLRVLRVSRLIRLVNRSKGLQALIQTITFSLPPLLNVLALLLIVFFIYAVLGVFLFGDIQEGTIIDHTYMNFNNFGNAILILLRMLTGEDWPTIMYDTQANNNEASYVVISTLYFVSYRLVGADIMLNLFILIIL